MASIQYHNYILYFSDLQGLLLDVLFPMVSAMCHQLKDMQYHALQGMYISPAIYLANFIVACDVTSDYLIDSKASNFRRSQN